MVGDGPRPVFIVGCPRSGTTLLRLMLDGHPGLAIPDESHFIVELWRAARREPPRQTLERILAHRRFQRWKLDPAVVRQRFDVLQPRSYAELIGVVFGAYAEAQGKARWGDKSPPYVRHVRRLAEMFPSAQFLHLIRDGREVAISLSEQVWWEHSPIAAATFWRREVAKGRRAGSRLGAARYLEIRYEALVRQPEAVLGPVCEFLGEDFTSGLLDYRASAHDRVWSGGSEDPDRVDHRHLCSPPTPALRDWRKALSAGEQRAVEAAAQPLLGELGYASGPRTVAALLRVQADQVRRLPRSIRSDLRQRTGG